MVMLSMLVREHMNLLVLGLLLALFGWAWDGRVIRSLILSLREREFTYTATLSGCKYGQTGIERIYAIRYAADFLHPD